MWSEAKVDGWLGSKIVKISVGVHAAINVYVNGLQKKINWENPLLFFEIRVTDWILKNK